MIPDVPMSKMMARLRKKRPYVHVDCAGGSEDLLVYERSFPEPFDVTNHSTPKRLGRMIKNVKRVVLTHFYPQAEGCEEDMALEVSELSGAPVLAGWDMMTLIL